MTDQRSAYVGWQPSHAVSPSIAIPDVKTDHFQSDPNVKHIEWSFMWLETMLAFIELFWNCNKLIQSITKSKQLVKKWIKVNLLLDSNAVIGIKS